MNITKYTVVLAGVAAAFISSPVVAQTATDEAVTVAQKPEKITDRRHPDFIRCRSETVIGSRAKKRRICLTNREWKAHAAEGNQRAKTMIRDHQSGLSGS